jgi:hypothetical protein
LAGEAYGLGNAREAVRTELQQGLCPGEPAAQDILMRRLPGCAFELPREVHGAEVRDRCQLGERKIVGEPILYKVKHPSQCRAIEPGTDLCASLKSTALYERVQRPYIDPNGEVLLESLREQQEWFLQNKAISAKVDVESLMDRDLVAYALGGLGRVTRRSRRRTAIWPKQQSSFVRIKLRITTLDRIIANIG